MKHYKKLLSYLLVVSIVGSLLIPTSVWADPAEGADTNANVSVEDTEAGDENDANIDDTSVDAVDSVDANEGTEENSAADASDTEDPAADGNLTELALPAGAVNEGVEITGSFAAVSGYDIATVRYVYQKDGQETYGFAEIEGSAEAGYTYSFNAPVNGFVATEGSNLNPADNATVIAHYYNTSVWDGAVDVSWYDEESSDFNIYNPAQFAGFAAIVNGSVDGNIEPYQVKGSRSNPADISVNRGLPDFIESTYYDLTDLIAGVKDCAYKGVMKHDFADRTVHIMSDLDMGGADGSQITMGAYDIGTDDPNSNWNRNLYDYPNWTPIGGEYLMDVSDSNTMIIAFFNGTIDGHGHNINNLYCYRWSYRSVGDTAYGYSQGTGLVGDMGTLYDDDRGTESDPETLPAIRDLGLSGFVYGRRMVGGFVGCIGGGANAADGTSVPGGICLENLANHAYVYCTDSKGLGGIAGCSMTAGSIINCYNDGLLTAKYSAPTGGIVGANEAMDIFSCYNIGSATAFQEHARGIGGDSSGGNYTVDSCYFLENSGNDTRYPGYYAYNLAPSISVNVTEMSDAQMKSAALLNGLNVNGTAYVAGDDGYPVLYWEKESGNGNLSIVKPAGGNVTAPISGELPNGKVVYLNNEAESGWNFRNYTLNGEAMTGDYVTVNGDTQVSAFFESAKAGVLKITPNKIVDIKVTKNGTVIGEDGQLTAVTGYEVKEGDSVYEGDVLIVSAHVKEGMVPANPSYTYKDTEGLPNPFDFNYQYTGGEVQTTNALTFTVGNEINGDDVSLTLDVVPLTTPKLWIYEGDTSWYDESQTEFTITTPEQLAGIDKLVSDSENPVTFEGKTIKLGCDIDLSNNDGTDGIRSWDGIGLFSTNTAETSYGFSGSFDGQGHKITGIKGCKFGLFGYVLGASDSDRVSIKNVELYGEVEGANPAGIAAYAQYADFSNINVYMKLKGGMGTQHAGGVIAYAKPGTSITNCNNYGSIESKGKVGGIAGEISTTTTLSNCVNKGGITCLSSETNNVGGITGSQNGQIEKCANYGNILAWGRNVGGIAGQSVSAKSTTTDCYNVGDVTLDNGAFSSDSIGGIMGYGSYYKLYNCYNYGSINIGNRSIATSYIGGLIGREGKRSSSTSENVYYLDTTCEYAENCTAFEELPGDKTYCQGFNVAAESDFADSSKVLAAINGNKSFSLTNGIYPELTTVASLHVHSGGEATCSHKAVCAECGLEYGELDQDNHPNLVKRNEKSPAWTTAGYSGDMVCRDCGKLVSSGEEIPADTTKDAITVIINGNTKIQKTYTVAEFDALKTTGTPIGYGYGGGYTEAMAAVEYVTIADILNAYGYTLDQVENLEVKCAGSKDQISGETLRTCNKYYDAEGNEFDAPAAVAMNYGSFAGTLEEIAHEAVPSNELRFGFGMSPQQHEENTNLGGRRLVSPVQTLTFSIIGETPAEHEHQMRMVDGKCQHVCDICEEPECKISFDMCGIGYQVEDKYCCEFDDVETPLNSRYTFDGWYLDKEYNDKFVCEGNEFADDTTVYAKWTEKVFLDKFVDVKKGSWYYFDVYSNNDRGIMTGTTPTTFAPNAILQREVFAVILYRFAGSKPVTYEKIFPDVPNGKYYSDGVIWAYKNGILSGYQNGRFGTGDKITREQMAKMIYFFVKDYLGLDVSEKTDITGFADYNRVASFAQEPFEWCVGAGIITGKENGTKLDPKGVATRAEAAAIMMRLVNKYHL